MMTEEQRGWLVVACVHAGVLAVLCIASTIAYDLVALRRGWRTVSEDAYRLSSRWTWVAVVLTGVLAFACGVLCGHLFFPQFM